MTHSPWALPICQDNEATEICFCCWFPLQSLSHSMTRTTLMGPKLPLAIQELLL
jgi:hypothetical protein